MMRLPSSVAIIGKGLDLKYEDARGVRKRINLRGLALCAGPDRRTLFLWPRPTREHRRSLDSFPKPADIFRVWHQFGATEVLEGSPRLASKVTRLGTMVEIGYRSDKWKQHDDDYEHTYTSGVRLDECGDVLRLSGGQQRVTADGIKG